MDADESLFDFTERVRAFGRNAARDVAVEAAPRVERALKETASAGTDPYGNPWPAKKDGGRALVHAADAIVCTADGEAVVAKVTGLHAIHNAGTPHRLPQRQLLPDGGDGMPPKIAKVMRDSAATVFQRALGGG